VRWSSHQYLGYFRLVRVTGVFLVVLPTFVLVSRIQFVQQYRDNDHFLITSSSSRHEAMVGDSLDWSSVLRVGLGRVSVGLPSCLDRFLTHLIRGFLVC
jgi:hypothetical protein